MTDENWDDDAGWNEAGDDAEWNEAGDDDAGWKDDGDEEDGGGWDVNPIDEDGAGDAAGMNGDDWTIEVENLYYTAESERKDDPEAALEKFQKCVQLEEEKSEKVDKRFLALTYVVVLLFQLRKVDEMVQTYTKLLGYSDKVAPNDLNKAIRTILNTVQESTNSKALAKMYEITLDFFQKRNDTRFWFEYAMRLCKTYFDTGNLKQCIELLDKLHASCQTPEGEDDLSKGSQLLEIYAIRIQVMAAKNDRVALSELFERTSKLSTDINEPKAMSVIKECWGKMYASMNNWDEAYNNFFEAFKMYQDIGNTNAKSCLKYVILASMLSDLERNPFASQEARVLENHSEIVPMRTLLDAFEKDEIGLFEKTLEKDKGLVLNDSFIKEHMPALKLRLRSRVLVKLIKPYKRVKLEWLCRHLNATMEEVENLVVNSILDGSVYGRINQIHSLLDLDFVTETDKLHNAMDGWIKTVRNLQGSIAQRSGRYEVGFRGMGPMGGMGMGMDFEDDPFMGLVDDFDVYSFM